MLGAIATHNVKLHESVRIAIVACPFVAIAGAHELLPHLPRVAWALLDLCPSEVQQSRDEQQQAKRVKLRDEGN